MRLHPHWKQIATRAWSIRWMILAGLFSAAEVAIPMFGDRFDRGTFAILSGAAVALAFVSRLLAQKNMNDGD